MPYIFEHDNYHLILVLYIFLVENAKLKNEVYKNLVKLVQNFLVIHYKFWYQGYMKKNTLSKICDGVFCENS